MGDPLPKRPLFEPVEVPKVDLGEDGFPNNEPPASKSGFRKTSAAAFGGGGPPKVLDFPNKFSEAGSKGNNEAGNAVAEVTAPKEGAGAAIVGLPNTFLGSKIALSEAAPNPEDVAVTFVFPNTFLDGSSTTASSPFLSSPPKTVGGLGLVINFFASVPNKFD